MLVTRSQFKLLLIQKAKFASFTLCMTFYGGATVIRFSTFFIQNRVSVVQDRVLFLFAVNEPSGFIKGIRTDCQISSIHP